MFLSILTNLKPPVLLDEFVDSDNGSLLSESHLDWCSLHRCGVNLSPLQTPDLLRALSIVVAALQLLSRHERFVSLRKMSERSVLTSPLGTLNSRRESSRLQY
ncbi:hypothetical protein PoB_000191000 [Plakobranchus ocellatus]|uniref:Uncharacterized protein n=1 Tax=Plakobranchus ocellatus TaxID=259542 RepID=A0AAV3XXQ2_9GAST|nr:hypothetical protein PoB_000191000 [Plakobranchus ocellatus]